MVLILLVVIRAIFIISIPDYTYDTANYHIYLQENIRIDKINFDFFAGKTINGFLFPLGDRMHYIARYILGYRLGTIFSYYSFIAIFYEAKNLLNYINGKRKLNPLLAILGCGSFILIQWMGSYYIDTFSVLFTLKIISYLMIEKDCFEDKRKIYLLAILTGIATGIKLPNLIFIAPILALFMIARRKQLKLKNSPIYILAIIMFIIPFLLYIIDNVIQTGSPLYPYYNNILKSEYFGNYSWVEPLFGIPNWKYKLIWPIYTSIVKLGYGDRCYIGDPLFAVGYVTVLAYTIYGTIKWKKKNNELYYISLISLILTFLWIEFMYGYMRYALILPVLYGTVLASLVYKLLDWYMKEWLSTISKVLLHKIVLVNSVLLVLILTVANFKVSDMNNVLENYSLVFKDKKETSIHIDGVWGVIGDDSGLTQILREKDTPIYNLHRELFTSSEKALEKYNELIENNDDIYILILKRYFSRTNWYLINNGLYMEKVKQYNSDEIPYLDKDEVLYLYKLVKE